MNLNINSPMYCTKQFGVIEEIYKMCQDIQNVVKGKTYSPVIDTVGITPIIAPQNILDSGLFKEIRKCEIRYGFASVSLQIDYEKYVNADINQKKRLMINNILASIKSIHKNAKIDFVDFEMDVVQYGKNVGILSEN